MPRLLTIARRSYTRFHPQETQTSSVWDGRSAPGPVHRHAPPTSSHQAGAVAERGQREVRRDRLRHVGIGAEMPAVAALDLRAKSQDRDVLAGVIGAAERR